MRGDGNLCIAPERVFGWQRLNMKNIQGCIGDLTGFKCGQKVVIPTCTDQHSCAHLRIPMDLMRAGWAISLFQASQQ